MTLTRLVAAVGRLPDADDVTRQGFDFRPSWWQARIPEPSWTNFLDTLPESELGQGYRHITRADLFAAADGGLPHGALLLAVYAWGTGNQGRRVGRRAMVFRYNAPATITATLKAAHTVLAERGPRAAYETLSRHRTN